MGEVVLARTSPTLHPPSPATVHQLSRLALYELTFHNIPYMYMSSNVFALGHIRSRDTIKNTAHSTVTGFTW